RMAKMENDELIFGKNAVLAFLEKSAEESDGEAHDDARRAAKVKVNKILLASGFRPDNRIDRIQEIARKNKIPLQSVDRKKLDQIAGPERRHQGVVALISPAELWQLDTFLEKLELDRMNRELQGKSMDGYVMAVLDGIEDPHNLGAIIRVAESAGVQGILIPQHRAAGLTGTV